MRGSWYIPWKRLIMHNEKSIESELKTIVNGYPVLIPMLNIDIHCGTA